MTTEIILSNLGLYLPSIANYSESANAFLTNGYVSTAGNTYFNAIRMGNGFVIKEDVGQGYLHTFLNGIRIYSLKDRQLIADKTFHNNIYSPDKVKSEACDMLTSIIIAAARNEGNILVWSEVRNVIKKEVYSAFETDQRKMLTQQSGKYLAY